MFLVEEGADVNKMYSEDRCALLRAAACMGKLKCLEVLLQAGADVNSIDIHRNTALIKAIKWNQEQCVNRLIQAGADVECH